MWGQLDSKMNFVWLTRRPLLFVAFFYLAGILIGEFIYLPIIYSLVTALIFLILYVLFFKKQFAHIFLAVMICSAGVCAYTFVASPTLPQNISAGTLYGRIDDISHGEYSSTYTLSEVVFQTDDTQYQLGKRIFLSTTEDSFEPNDYILAFNTELSEPSSAPYEFGFDDKNYCLANNVAYRAWSDEVSFSKRATDITSMFYDLRTQISYTLDEILPENASLAKAILLGIQDEMSDAEIENFRESGLSHLLVVSGLHLSTLAFVLIWIMRKLSVNKFISFAIILIFLLSFVLLTGGKISIVRAAIMLITYSFIKLLMIDYDSITSLSLAFLIIVFPNPAVIFDIGFQLSFASVLSIICITPLFQRLFVFKPSYLWQGLCTSAAATLGTAPLVINLTNKFSPLYILFNIVAIPVCTICLPLIIICLIFFALFGSSFEFLYLITDNLLQLLSSLADIFGNIGSIVLPSIAPIILMAYYLLILVLSKSPPNKNLPAVVALGAFSLSLTVLPKLCTSAPLEISFVDVGSADAIHIKHEDTDILIDTGKEKYGVVDYVIKNGIYPDMTIISHSDADHSGGLIPLSEYSRTGTVYSSAPEISKIDLPATALLPGDKFEFGECVLSVLDTNVGDDGTTNQNSLVLLLTYKGENICLFTGDAEKEQELNAISGGITAPILKVSHHGSSTSTSREFILNLKPKIAVVSNGKEIPEQTKQALEDVQIFETLQFSTITAKIDDKIYIEVYNERY